MVLSAVGLAFMVLLFVINTVLMNKLRVYQKAMMSIRDKRVKVINEVLNGIKVSEVRGFYWPGKNKYDRTFDTQF